MNDKEHLLSEEQLDFLREMMNIGAGNAVTALTQMLQCEVNVRIPLVHVLSAPKVPAILSDPSLPVTCVRMSMVGEAAGDLFFIVPDEQKMLLIRLMERATPGPKKKGTDVDLSVLTEIGNILAGVYLTAIHDFCKLNMYHSVPKIAIDMIQSILDESLATLSREAQEVVLILNEFITDTGNIRTFFLLVPHMKAVKILVDAIEQARRALRDSEGATG